MTLKVAVGFILLHPEKILVIDANMKSKIVNQELVFCAQYNTYLKLFYSRNIQYRIVCTLRIITEL